MVEDCGHDPLRARWQSVGPFKEYRCVVDGWVVPLLDVRELDGGRVFITVNGWRGMECSTSEADNFIPFLADVIASAIGYRAHPSDQYDDEEQRDRVMAAVPHESLGPYRLKEIVALDDEDEHRAEDVS